jgi:oxygen-independent coproporphyrinogen-3 oxidase
MGQKSQLARYGLFDAKVPRYTSYPTVPSFGADVNAAVFSDWFTHIPPGSEVSLYVHIPFCRRLCWFCACRTQGAQFDAPVLDYMETLKAEFALVKTRLPEGVKLSRVHWGGGTPSLLSADMIRTLAATQFDLAPLTPQGEFSVEIDPNECDAQRLDALCDAGMTRAFVGVQDFDQEIQQTIGRLQSFETTHELFEMLRARGVESISAEVLFGLPHQTAERLTHSLQKLLSLSPERIAAYGYAHVPWMARRQTMIPSETLPTPEACLELFETARQLLIWDGYREIGIDHFALPQDNLIRAQQGGRLRRDFQGYTDDTNDVLIGIGASAISRFPQGYAQNATGTADHAAAVARGVFSTSRGHILGGEDRVRARLIEALMCDFGIHREEILSRFSVSAQWLDRLLEKTAYAFPGMMDLSPDGLFVRDHARPLTRMMARSLDAYNSMHMT